MIENNKSRSSEEIGELHMSIFYYYIRVTKLEMINQEIMAHTLTHCVLETDFIIFSRRIFSLAIILLIILIKPQ